MDVSIVCPDIIENSEILSWEHLIFFHVFAEPKPLFKIYLCQSLAIVR